MLACCELHLLLVFLGSHTVLQFPQMFPRKMQFILGNHFLWSSYLGYIFSLKQKSARIVFQNKYFYQWIKTAPRKNGKIWYAWNIIAIQEAQMLTMSQKKELRDIFPFVLNEKSPNTCQKHCLNWDGECASQSFIDGNITCVFKFPNSSMYNYPLLPIKEVTVWK